jgi:hypothetical protein
MQMVAAGSLMGHLVYGVMGGLHVALFRGVAVAEPPGVSVAGTCPRPGSHLAFGLTSELILDGLDRLA